MRLKQIAFNSAKQTATKRSNRAKTSKDKQRGKEKERSCKVSKKDWTKERKKNWSKKQEVNWKKSVIKWNIENKSKSIVLLDNSTVQTPDHYNNKQTQKKTLALNWINQKYVNSGNWLWKKTLSRDIRVRVIELYEK